MCGLAGAAGDLNAIHEKVLRQLLVLDALRGEDSTGVAFVHKFNNDTTVSKALGDPYNLFNDGKFAKGMSKANRVLLGHNRYATSGGVNKSGAHPFEFETLIGAHNGTLGARYRLDDDKDFKVDSQALYHNIEKNGLKETIKRLGGQGNAWSLVWWDKIELTINFLRNKERPMFMCRSADSKVLFWASEAWMLDVALFRNDVKRGEIFQTEVDMHYSVHVDKAGAMHKPKLVHVEADPVVYLPQQNFHNRPQHINRPVQPPATVVELKPSTPALPAPATPASKEVDVSKKASTPANTSGLASDPSYVSAKGRTFEILCVKKDGNGGQYLSLFDPKEQFVDIRLYPCKTDQCLFEMEGCDITGDISNYEKVDVTALRGYYKVSPWTVKYEAPAEDEAVDETLMDHRGRLVTTKEWKQQYSVCQWCSDVLDPLKNNRYTTMGDCLCPDCVRNEEVTQYVTLV